MAKLIFTDKNHAGRTYELILEKTTVGRGDQNTLVISDASLSAQHCEILLNGSEVIVRDLGSRNGTFVNGAKLTNQQSQMKSGQTVRFGAVEARLDLDGHGEASDDTSSEMTAVHAMGRIMRDQRRERENPKPTNASMKLDSPGSSQDGDRTVTAHDAPKSKGSPAPAAPMPAVSEPEATSRTRIVVIAAVVVLGLIFFLRLWWGRR